MNKTYFDGIERVIDELLDMRDKNIDEREVLFEENRMKEYLKKSEESAFLSEIISHLINTCYTVEV